MHLSSILLVLSLSLPFRSVASPAYLDVDTADTLTTLDIDPEIDVISPFQAYDDDVLSYLVDAGSVIRRSRSHSAEKRATKDWTYVGCTQDGTARALAYVTRQSGLTPQKCMAICEAQSSKYIYSAVQFGVQCFCGDKLLNGYGNKVTESQCNTVCPGDKTQMCGGAYRNSLYKRNTISADKKCHKADQDPTTTAKPTTAVATTQAASTTKAATSSTPLPSQALVATVQQSRRLGCFTDSSTDRMLSGASYRQNDNTPDKCWTFCASKGFLVAAVQYGNYCYCGNTVDWGRKVSDGECNMACAGDKTVKCGAGNRNEVYTQATNVKVGTPAIPPASRRWLWAHHMVGNTYSYTQNTWRSDILLAADAGLDGFALNMGRDDWQPARVADAYAAAKAYGSAFKVFFSLDMTSFPCNTAAQAQQYAQLVASYKSHSNQAFYQNKLLLTLFDGAYCTFGQGSVDAGWAYFRAQMTALNTPVYIMPSIFVGLEQQNWFDGHFDWDNSWPQGAEDLDGSQDIAAKAQMTARRKGYMPGISPNFFTYYAPQSYNKNWIYRSDDWLLATRFEQIIQQRESHDMAELISWNDFGESHYVGLVGDSRPDQPMSQGWTTGMPHNAWLHLIRYYAQAYRTGSYFSNRDSVYLWSRPHPKNGNPTNVSPGLSRPARADYTEDNLYVVAILSAPSDVVVTAGTNVVTYKNLPVGLTKISVASAEGSIGAKIVRGGATIKQYGSGGHFKWSKTFRDWNFNYFVASAE